VGVGELKVEFNASRLSEFNASRFRLMV
jgi:hypothetical protein